MRFQSGTRDNNKKGKPSAAQMYKDRLAARSGDKPPPSKDEIYKKLIEDRMAKIMEDYLLGKKKNANALPGTKQGDDKPKEVSKSALTVIRMLAVRREQKERKAQKRKEVAFTRAKQAKASEEKRLKMLAEQAELQKQAQLQAELNSNNNNSSYFWGSGDDNKNGWW